jgi:hypothetical protein
MQLSQAVHERHEDKTADLCVLIARLTTTGFVRCLSLHPDQADFLWLYIGLNMPKSPVSRFNCPNCDASYMVVRVRAGPSTLYRQLTCRSCDGPLEAQKGRFILKYFLLEESRIGVAAPSRKYLS